MESYHLLAGTWSGDWRGDSWNNREGGINVALKISLKNLTLM